VGGSGREWCNHRGSGRTQFVSRSNPAQTSPIQLPPTATHQPPLEIITRFFFPGYGAYKWFTGPARTVDDSASSMADGGKDADRDVY
jgi:hypothetical protein